ncbi:MAG TPA: hypothetical protein DGG94_05255 [Micromonosporaceae bacterium]|nr:hypothetical protein [Micromonosporaceae bacterium]HCU49207.1 hypothetical protein [Micromonosporaceae bacterium]
MLVYDCDAAFVQPSRQQRPKATSFGGFQLAHKVYRYGCAPTIWQLGLEDVMRDHCDTLMEVGTKSQPGQENRAHSS